ncbi:gamma-glutamylcyclotransferase family protein [Mucisphaera sp.]|uniref:gamma-glutamylcyclotransferase family protein n=1 Tax=Mucisphaera sp. TaxID=2913024 RepID=UPI003D0A64A2
MIGIFGYGSLIQTDSRLTTVAKAQTAQPCLLAGYERLWNTRAYFLGGGISFLGLRPQADHQTNGVFFLVDLDGYDALRQRETGYVPVNLEADQLLPVADNKQYLQADIARADRLITFCSADSLEPTATYPIVQSYLDICLTGCLEIDDHLNQPDHDFTRQFLDTTSGWNEHWVNDRIHPRRPFAACPRARDIDNALRQTLPHLVDLIRNE